MDNNLAYRLAGTPLYLSPEHVSGQSGLEEHLSCIWWKEPTRLKVKCDHSTKYNEGVRTSRLTMN